MFSRPPIITSTGITLLLRAAGGEAFQFTKFVIGDGRLPDGESEQSADQLAHHVMDVTITRAENTEQDGYIKLTGTFDNANMESGFLWTELGLIAVDEEENEYLYAYAFDSMYAEYIQPSESAVVTEQSISIIIAVGESENITAYVLPNATYATKREFDDHIHDYDNPHHVTPEQIGAAQAEHYHSAEDILSGILPVERGGTGATSLSELRELLGLNFAVGSFVGDGTQRKDISLGFQPSGVYIFKMASGANWFWRKATYFIPSRIDANNNIRHTVPYEQQASGLYFAPGNNAYYSFTGAEMATCDADTLLNVGRGGAAVTSDGFAVGYNVGGRDDINESGLVYFFVAMR